MFARQSKGRAAAGNPSTSRTGLSRVLRSVSPTAVAVTLSLLIGGAGFADAATGGTFILGKNNFESSTASLNNSKGTPLSLVAPFGTAPLAVNRQTMVKNLNAQYLGGLTATKLSETGGIGFDSPGTDTPISDTSTMVATTGELSPGIYYVSATAELTVKAGDIDGACYIALGSAPDTALNWGGANQEGTFTTAETAAYRLTATDTFQEYCLTDGNNGSDTYDAGIFAIRILSSSG